MFFGDVTAVGSWEGDPRVEIHGPGYSKVLIGDDQLASWEAHVDLIAASIADNGGRSCVNASGVWVNESHAEQVATALAKKLVQIVPRSADDPAATLAPFYYGLMYGLDAILMAIVAMSGLLIYRHGQNIANLLAGKCKSGRHQQPKQSFSLRRARWSTKADWSSRAPAAAFCRAAPDSRAHSASPGRRRPLASQASSARVWVGLAATSPLPTQAHRDAQKLSDIPRQLRPPV